MTFFPVASFFDHKKFQVGYSNELYQTIGKQAGSFKIVECRLFGMPYHDYIRTIRDKYSAEVWDKKEGQLISYQFSNKADCAILCGELNKRWNYMMKN